MRGGGEVELLGQPGDRDRRRGGHGVRDETQPRQGAQRHREPEPVGGAASPAGIDERAVGAGEGEVPEQPDSGTASPFPAAMFSQVMGISA